MWKTVNSFRNIVVAYLETLTDKNLNFEELQNFGTCLSSCIL